MTRHEHFGPETIRILDSPPGTSCPVIEATRTADLVILVTEPTPFGLHDLKLAVGTMRTLGKEFLVVVNRFGSGNDEVMAYCEQEGIEVIATIPDQRRIAELYSEGKLLFTEVPEVKAAMRLISDRILNMMERRVQ